MKRHRRDYEMIADMNLTNLLDTAFVLLIAFIMASPTMRAGLNVDLPEVVKDPGSVVQKPQSEPLTISIRKHKELEGQPEWFFADEGRVDLTDGPNGLETLLKAKKMLHPDGKIDVIIQMDRDGRYDALAQVLSILRSQGIDSVGLPMIPLETAPGNGPPAGGDQKKD